MAERLLLASAVEGEDELHLDVVAEGEAVALQGRALAGEVEECPPRAIAEGRGVPDQTSRGLVWSTGSAARWAARGAGGCRRGMEQDGPALEVEGGESRLVGLLEGRGVQEQDGPALEVEGGESRLVGLLEGRGVQEQDGPALEVEGGESRLVGLLEGRWVPEQDGPALEVEGGESRLVGLLEGRGVPEQDGPALEVEGGESRLVGLLEGRWVPEQDGPALEVEGGESRLVGLLEGRGVPEQDGPALEVEGGESRLVGLLEGRWGPEQDGQALEVEGEESRLVMLLEGEDAPEQDGALTTVGNPGARAFDVNTVLRRAREWYRAEDIDTGRTTGTQGSEMGGFTEHFHPASALALPWPDCGQRGNIPAQGPDEPACEDDPVPVDAREDGDEAADGEGEPGIHVRTGFYRNRRGSSYRIGGIMLLHWARLFAVTLRFGIYTSNAAESINSAVRGIRMLPPTWLLASLWDWSRDKWYERKEKARCRDEYLTAAASKRLDQKKQRCQGYWFIGGDNTSLSSLSPPFHSPAALPLSHRLPLSRPFLSLVAFPLSRRLPLSCRLSSLSSPFLSRCPSSLPLPVLTPSPFFFRLPPPSRSITIDFLTHSTLRVRLPLLVLSLVPSARPIARTIACPVDPSSGPCSRSLALSPPFPSPSLSPLPSVALALSPPFLSPSFSPLPFRCPRSLPSLSAALALSPPFPSPSLSHLPFRGPRSLPSLPVALFLSPPFPSPSLSPLPFRRPHALLSFHQHQ
ncbi:unnamed protein product [Closterium sp. NIES-64]|nr:unnamed protein product [Closterium sp. NIES-64]